MKCIHEHNHEGLERTLRIIEDKWTVALIHHIVQGTNRFGRLMQAMEGISAKTLSLRLDELEQEGVIVRRVFPEVPPHVEYYLTAKGRSLRKVIQVMDEWGNGRA